MNDEVVGKPKLAVGEVVRIKSGSQKMTIASIRKGRANCVYSEYHSGQVFEYKIPIAVLERV